jgi:hypothetical protein
MIDLPSLPHLEDIGWEFRWQLTAIEPAEAPIDLQGAPLHPPPRSNIVVSRVPSNVQSAKAAADEFLQQTKQVVADIRHKFMPDMEFPDGVSGAVLEVTFQASPEVTLWQQHVFRLDPDCLTQLVLTCDSRLSDEEKGELANHVRGFTLKPRLP